MKKSSFKPYDLSKFKRKNISISRFGGVDYSSQKFLVGSGRAIDILNFIYKDGVVQKRNGIEQIIEAQDVSYIPADFSEPTKKMIDEVHSTSEGGKKINGIWSFVAEDGKEHVVAHIGRLMYEIKDIDDRDSITCEPIPINAIGSSFATETVGGEVRRLLYEFEDFRSFAFVGGKKLWFMGGNRYMVLRFINGKAYFKQVQDSEYSPIPVTTMSITYKNSIASGRQSLDDVNLLTKWRKNRLISGTTKSEDDKTRTEFYEYTLDAPLIAERESDMSDIEITIEESGVIN